MNSTLSDNLKEHTVYTPDITIPANSNMQFELADYYTVPSGYTVISFDMSIGGTGYSSLRILPRGRTKHFISNDTSADRTINIDIYLILAKTSLLTEI